MGMERVRTLLLSVVVGLPFLVVVGFHCLSKKKKRGSARVEQKPGLTVELARVGAMPIEGICLREFGVDRVNKLLLETAEPDCELLDHLDKNLQFDENLQFLRLSEGYCGRPSWKVIKYRCQLASVSESFYACRLVSNRGDPSQSQPPIVRVKAQWLYTVIQPQQRNPNMMEIHSNVVPQEAYLKRLQGVNPTCSEHQSCTQGFSRIGVLCEKEPYHHSSCTKCAFGDQLNQEAAHVDAELTVLRNLDEADMESVDQRSGLGDGTQGAVQKIYWRKGLFAKKAFFRESDFEIEQKVAKEVLHPNIVHCFGFSKCPPFEQFCGVSLYMELLEESLDTRIQEPRQKECPFFFQDIVSVLWQVADAMRELHEKGFIHGDLKPANILLSGLKMPHSKSGMFYLAKVADFGCAQRVPPEGFANPESHEAVFFNSKIGTTEYTAPEVFRHRLDESLVPTHPEKIDVYSFGVVAYQMLSGVSVLYVDYKYKPTKLKAGVMNGSLKPSTETVINGLDRARKSLFKSLVVKCWAPDPKERPSFSFISDELKKLSGEYGAHGYMEFFSAVMASLKATIAKREDKMA